MRFFNALLTLYPAEHRVEYGAEMRAVFQALAPDRTAWREYLGLARGALLAHIRRLRLMQSPGTLLTGSLFAFGMHLLMYWSLVPGKGKALHRVLQDFAARLFLLCLMASLVFPQQAPRQDPATLELARTIYGRAFRALREAKTLEDMKKLADSLDAADWISMDRFGRTVLTRQEADQELTSLLNLAPERRVTEMDVLWAEEDGDRLMVLAWMMPHETKNVDAEGNPHRLMEGTLVRDLFRKTATGWLRFRHDKLVPNSTVLAVDGVPRIVPPLEESRRITALP